MGGRGSSGGARRAEGVFTAEKPFSVETVYREARGWQNGYFKDTILQAVDKGGGEVELVYAKADLYSKSAKTNRTNYVTYTLDHGFVNDQPHGLNFDKITAFSGKTYSAKEELKKRGYKFSNGKWVKR